jgi:hypothetical protein
MIVIQRRDNTNNWEQIAVYKNGELTGDDDFIEAFGHLFEGQVNESMVIQRFDGPNLVASIEDTNTE